MMNFLQTWNEQKKIMKNAGNCTICQIEIWTICNRLLIKIR